MSVSLARPVASAMIPVDPLPPTTSLRRAADEMRDLGLSALPIAGPDSLIRFISASALIKALEQGREADSAAIDLAREDGVPFIFAHETGAAALRRLAENQAETLAVLDPAGAVIGMLRPADLYEKPSFLARPPLVGGMATPFGVYLTNGSIRAGAPWYALVATGALLASLLIAGVFVGNQMADFAFARHWPMFWTNIFESWLPFIFFCALMRFLPISGIHAAEHMTVHAIERGENLVPEVVRRMPRVHPRCGTNLAVAASLFVGVFALPWPHDLELKLLLGALAALLLRIPLGSLMQYWVTTKPPSEKQLQMGIRAGNELLQRYQFAPRASSTPFQRILASGLIFVMMGSMSVVFLAHLLGME